MLKWLAKLLCRWGIHRPMKEICYVFTDVVNGGGVYEYRCACGREWMGQRGDGFRSETYRSRWERSDKSLTYDEWVNAHLAE